MSRHAERFAPETLLGVLSGLPECNRLLVGFSGGADSTALLLALHQLLDRLDCSLEAVHFNHGLQDQAAQWEEHCKRFCKQLQVPLQVHKLALAINAGSSPETMAREARYEVIKQLLAPGDIYLTAHQADDQAETVLLNLMRGSGVAGLAGIPALRRFGSGWLARPLLPVERSALEEWLKSENVPWIHDTTNQDFSMDRNFLRGEIIPRLEGRWPGVVRRIHQSAEHLQERSDAFHELLIRTPELVSTNGFTLGLREFSQASMTLQAEIIRHWAQQRNAPPPPRARLREFLQQLQQARIGNHAELNWRGWLIKHQGGQLWLHEWPAPPPCPVRCWEEGQQLELGAAHGTILLKNKPDYCLTGALAGNRSALTACEEIHSSGKHKLKEIMRLSGIPAWLRDCIPVLVVNGELSAVGDWWFSPKLKACLEEHQQHYSWKVENPLLKHVQSVCHNWTVDPGNPLV